MILGGLAMTSTKGSGKTAPTGLYREKIMQLKRFDEKTVRIARVLTENRWQCTLSQADELYYKVNGESNYLYYDMDDWSDEQLYAELENYLFEL